MPGTAVVRTWQVVVKSLIPALQYRYSNTTGKSRRHFKNRAPRLPIFVTPPPAPFEQFPICIQGTSVHWATPFSPPINSVQSIRIKPASLSSTAPLLSQGRACSAWPLHPGVITPRVMSFLDTERPARSLHGSPSNEYHTIKSNGLVITFLASSFMTAPGLAQTPVVPANFRIRISFPFNIFQLPQRNQGRHDSQPASNQTLPGSAKMARGCHPVSLSLHWSNGSRPVSEFLTCPVAATIVQTRHLCPHNHTPVPTTRFPT
jgi:hypothetical protein